MYGRSYEMVVPFRLCFACSHFTFYLFPIKRIMAPSFKITACCADPVFTWGIFTYLLHPIVEKLHQTGMHRGLAALGIYLLFFGGVGYGLYKGIPAFIHQLNDLVDHAPEFAEQYRSLLL